MATGDIKNNLRKLQTELRKIKYPSELDLDGITTGNWQALEPIYQYAFGPYSSPISEEIHDKLGFQLSNRTDTRFLEGLYRLLRDLYKYKPPVTRDQFTASGFAERKIIMCTEVLQMVETRHGEITGRFSRSSQMSSSSDTVTKSQTYRSDPAGERSQLSSARGTSTELHPLTLETVDLPVMEAGSDANRESEMPRVNADVQGRLQEDQGNGHSDVTTFWEFQQRVEKNFNKIITRITLLEARMAAMETKMEMVQPKDRSLVQRVKPMVKSN